MSLTEQELKNSENNFYKILGDYFSYRPTGFYGAVGKIGERIESLNETLKKADESSTNLTQALNNLTRAGVVIAGISLLFEILKYFKVI